MREQAGGLPLDLENFGLLPGMSPQGVQKVQADTIHPTEGTSVGEAMVQSFPLHPRWIIPCPCLVGFPCLSSRQQSLSGPGALRKIWTRPAGS